MKSMPLSRVMVGEAVGAPEAYSMPPRGVEEKEALLPVGEGVGAAEANSPSWRARRPAADFDADPRKRSSRSASRRSVRSALS